LVKIEEIALAHNSYFKYNIIKDNKLLDLCMTVDDAFKMTELEAILSSQGFGNFTHFYSPTQRSDFILWV